VHGGTQGGRSFFFPTQTHFSFRFLNKTLLVVPFLVFLIVLKDYKIDTASVGSGME